MPEEPQASIEEKVNRSKVRITRQAFEQMNAYARKVSEIIGAPSEVMGYLIGEADDLSCTAKEAHLLHGQDVDYASVHPTGDGRSNIYESAEKEGKRIVGMWHSHGSIGNFHSADDDTALTDLLIDNTYTLLTELEIEGSRTPYASSIVISQESYLRERPSDSPEAVKHYYCCAAFRDRTGKKTLARGLEIELVEDRSREQPSEDEIEEQVREGVTHGGKSLRQMRKPEHAGILGAIAGWLNSMSSREDEACNEGEAE